jgi:hypothetical protein
MEKKGYEDLAENSRPRCLTHRVVADKIGGMISKEDKSAIIAIAKKSSMNRSQIAQAVEKAKRGIAQYTEIMELVSIVDVSINPAFQKKYNAFYRVRQHSAKWYVTYYSLMQESKKAPPSFDHVIDQINVSMGRYEPSFSSKLVATLNPDRPVWDVHILNNTGHSAPAYTAKNKIELAKAAYGSIERWYETFLNSNEGKLYIEVFDGLVPEHKKITNLKKIDFILWQTRGHQESGGTQFR